jgi:hypothetical protein
MNHEENEAYNQPDHGKRVEDALEEAGEHGVVGR